MAPDHELGLGVYFDQLAYGLDVGEDVPGHGVILSITGLYTLADLKPMDLESKCGLRAMGRLRAGAKAKGLGAMSLADINEEIKATRADRGRETGRWR